VYLHGGQDGVKEFQKHLHREKNKEKSGGPKPSPA